MNRRTRHLVVVAVAVLTATIASFGVYRAMERLPGRPGQGAPHPVVVAARSLPIGAQLAERDVKVVAWPTGSVVPGAIGSAAEVVNRGLLVGVLENEPLTEAKLASREAGAGLPPAIPSGMRAISIKVDDVIGVSGFVSPGSHVDLVVTIRREDDSMTRTVASNVQVLASGTRRSQQTLLEVDAKGTSVVTLMVSPEDAERIALAQSQGQIMLVLRNPLDLAPTVTAGIKTAALMGQSEAPPPPAPVAKPAPRRAAAPPPPPEPEPPVARARTVEAIRAAKRTEEVIR
jgi:pilus assembly protein CpaB